MTALSRIVPVAFGPSISRGRLRVVHVGPRPMTRSCGGACHGRTLDRPMPSKRDVLARLISGERLEDDSKPQLIQTHELSDRVYRKGKGD
jgi:hypothetical protein